MGLSGLSGLGGLSTLFGLSLPILDRLSETVDAAYSLRKVVSDYSGPAIRVRRSSDDTEQDINFLAGRLDTASLLSFVGAGNGFVKTIYDQSGNDRNATNATTGEQPIIVSSGVLEEQNGRPVVKFAGGKSLDIAYTFSQPFTYTSVAGRSALISSAYQSLFGGLSYSSTLGTQADTGYISMYAGSVLASSTVFPSILTSITAVFNGASSAIYKDGSSVASGNAGAQGVTTSLHINGWGGESHGDETGDYYFAEWFIFGSALPSRDRALLVNNQTAFYELGPMTFYKIWGDHWFERVPSGATYTSFQVTGDTEPGFTAEFYDYDLNYSVLTNNSDALETIYVAGSWEDRDSGTIEQGSVHLPNDFVLPDATTDPYSTPNNPLIILNEDTGVYVCLNGAARPVAGGPIYGYKDDTNPRTHGGSGLIGGEVWQSELDAGVISHAIALNVWGEKYLSSAGTGFVAPATKADQDYDDPEHGDYYGGNVPELVMGTRLAIPPDVTAASLGITSPAALAVFNAAKTYGFIVVDNTKGDAISINCDEDAAVSLEAVESELVAIYQALQIVEEP